MKSPPKTQSTLNWYAARRSTTDSLVKKKPGDRHTPRSRAGCSGRLTRTEESSSNPYDILQDMEDGNSHYSPASEDSMDAASDGTDTTVLSGDTSDANDMLMVTLGQDIMDTE